MLAGLGVSSSDRCAEVSSSRFSLRLWSFFPCAVLPPEPISVASVQTSPQFQVVLLASSSLAFKIMCTFWG